MTFFLNVAVMTVSRTSILTRIAVKIKIRFATRGTKIRTPSASSVLVSDPVNVAAVVGRVIHRHLENNLARVKAMLPNPGMLGTNKLIKVCLVHKSG